jgi:hypothetical protein
MTASGTSAAVCSLRACALTVRTGPSRYCRLSAWCTPSWIMLPPGLLSAKYRQVSRVSSSPRSLEKFASASETAPRRPSSTHCRITRQPDSRRALCPTASTCPLAAAAAAMAAASVRVCAIGLST